MSVKGKAVELRVYVAGGVLVEAMESVVFKVGSLTVKLNVFDSKRIPFYLNPTTIDALLRLFG